MNFDKRQKKKKNEDTHPGGRGNTGNVIIKFLVLSSFCKCKQKAVYWKKQNSQEQQTRQETQEKTR